MADPYFSVEYSAQVNLIPLGENETVPEVADLEADIPAPFRLISEVTRIDTNQARLLRNLDEHASELVDIINQQSRKIDLVLSHVLAGQDDPDCRYRTLTIGGGGFGFVSRHAMTEGQIVRIKLFLPEHSVAVYGYGEVHAEPEADHYRCDFTVIREQDRDALIRASLQQQARQLKARAEQRAQQDNKPAS
ncbi:PilZ domain-containing protein [Oceanimonas sp. CHS3-5]|uniref:PilZ domain-containing protein n=1 Tax=Oceanimonas sp. CHS3-5 TaxID=3068186 RepID=UPI00273FE760|nr:PilZ domain-containing protein [Oceanimonas sp. CHS3-5]MDP5291318.1 PilZ domain-containing protein [Oceanimonas sp. CHS3-5]